MVDKKYASECKQALKYLKQANYALKTGVFKWSKDYDEAMNKFEMAAKEFKKVGDEDSAAEAFLEYAKCAEHLKNHHLAADGYAQCATLLPDKQWQISFAHLKTAEFHYKMAGYSDRGFGCMKKFAMELCDQEDFEDHPSVQAGLEVYAEIFPKLFEDENMTMNYDMLETYPKALARAGRWNDFVNVRRMIMKHYEDVKTVDHRTRRIFIELCCIKMFTDDHYRIDDICQEFYRTVGGNPYEHNEYSICVGLQEACEKKDWDKADEMLMKPECQFVEIEVVKKAKKYVKTRPKEVIQVLQEESATGEMKKEDEEKALDDLLC